eukprot:augustus_masked-scaffold_12-processed-gene-8.0-mRNA-1 protein AED:0.23 eAED:0.26 QI:0/-1/0/1/-1/1/1/0/1238
MKLYNLTLLRSSASIATIYGNFTGEERAQEIIIGSSQVLTLLKVNDDGDLITLCEYDFFATLRTIKPLRLTGDTKDYIVVGTDGGSFTILEFSKEKNTFSPVVCEIFGKTGVRRVVPGEYIAVDPQGRAVMLASLEKNKLVYVTNRDSTGNLVVSSPLEAHKQHILVYDLVAMDVGFDNPMFAALEVNYERARNERVLKKRLTVYELDLGLNHVVRKWTKVVDESANKLVACPGGDLGPGGVLVCNQGFLKYYSLDQDPIACEFPLRLSPSGVPSEKQIIISHAVLGQKGLVFMLLQNEDGDLFQVKCKGDDETVTEVLIEYFDSIKPSRFLSITRKGLLFCSAETGNHILYQITDNIEGRNGEERNMSSDVASSNSGAASFVPRALRKLRHIVEHDVLSPCLGLILQKPINNASGTDIVLRTGTGPESSLKTLRHGLTCVNIAETKLPGMPLAVFTIKEKQGAEVDKYILVAFSNVSLVLSVGSKVEQVKDTGLLLEGRTFGLKLLRNNSVLQVHAGGFRLLNSLEDKSTPVFDWSAGNETVLQCAYTVSQLCLILSDNSICYFQLDELGNLSEVSRTQQSAIVSAKSSSLISAVAFSRTEDVSTLLAVAYGDKLLRIFSLKNPTKLEDVALQALPEVASSICFAAFSKYHLTMCIGLRNGVLITTNVHENTAKIQDSKSKYIGTEPVTLCPLTLKHNEETIPGVGAFSSRPWLLTSTQEHKVNLNPFNYPKMVYAHSFSNNQADGLVSLCQTSTGSSLRIFYMENIGKKFSIGSMKLEMTAREIQSHPVDPDLWIILEGEHGIDSLQNLQSSVEKYNKMRVELYGSAEPIQENSHISGGDEMETEEDDDDDEAKLDFSQIGYPNSLGWCSQLKVFRRTTGEFIFKQELSRNEYAVSMTMVRFRHRSGESFVVAGTVTGLSFYGTPKKFDSCAIKVYRFTSDGALLLMVAQNVDDLPKAMTGTPDGRLMVCIGRKICLYELSEKYLLLKGESKNALSSSAVKMFLSENGQKGGGILSFRLFVADSLHSMKIFSYYPTKKTTEAIALLCDDVSPRVMTAFEILDFDTIVGADKFGNIFVLRLPEDLEEALEPSIQLKLWDQANFDGAPNKLEQLAQFHVGEIITDVKKTSLSAGRPEVILYCTISGRVGVLAPIASTEDSELLEHIENQLRELRGKQLGLEQLSYRSSFIPLKHVVDGDFLNQFYEVSAENQQGIAEGAGRTSSSISSKIEELYMRLV